eukprot:TRINITY_DN13671_c0_g1_i2.p1 TRINITY_DN13671_c0_g1~~TRINITY_DN13671_c0_g1_i2.p1  ORF type:complete len:626 (-),score=65.06 TRINITY_DN13671_c0_g1_i2:34-1911(-)
MRFPSVRHAANYVWLSLHVMHSARRFSLSSNGFSGWDNILDLAPLFVYDDMTFIPKATSQQFKCCCDKRSCELVEVRARMSDGQPTRCANLGRPMLTSFHLHSHKMCPIRIADAFEAFGSAVVPDPESLYSLVKYADTTRFTYSAFGVIKATYGSCSSSCGEGVRSLIQVERDGIQVDMKHVPYGIAKAVPCRDIESCEWQCEHVDVCGWGKTTCNGDIRACQLRSEWEPAFPSKETFTFGMCFKPCVASHGGTGRSMCAVTVNHPDEQYGRLSSLISKTCFTSEKTRPDILILMVQELNHAGKMSINAKNDFPDFVYDGALPGYRLVSVCAPQMSANSAVFVREGANAHVFPRTSCSNEVLKSHCDWTNCKGNAVMEVWTSSGKLVVGNWHGARGGSESPERITEFEQAVRYIAQLQSFLGRKLVIWGGDVNVRSRFKKNMEMVDFVKTYTPSELWQEIEGDVLGKVGWTVDDHLQGKVGNDPIVQAILAKEPLRQVSGWDRLCPSYRKVQHARREVVEHVWNGTYKRYPLGIKKKAYITERVVQDNLKCVSDNVHTYGRRNHGFEYTDTVALEGPKSRAPSWTERIFVSDDLLKHCGEAKKNIDNRQDDHDPLFVSCTLPPLE